MENQRQRFTPAQRQRLLRKFHRSGWSQSEFAARHDLGLSTLGRWVMEERGSAGSSVSFQEMVLPATMPQWALEVVTPSGCTLRLQQAPEAGDLERVLRALR